MKFNLPLIRFFKINWLQKAFLFIALFLSLNVYLNAQSSNLIANTKINLTPSNGFNDLSVTTGVSGFSNTLRVKDTILTNFANYSSVLALGTKYIQVKDNDAIGSEKYKGGSYVGFIINSSTLLNLLGTINIETYDGTTPKDQISFSELLTLNLGSGRTELGFITTANEDFDAIRINFTYAVSASVNLEVYYAVIQEFESGIAPTCNDKSLLKNPLQPVAINPLKTNISGVLAFGSISNPLAVIDSDNTNFAELSVTGVSTTVSLSIANQIDNYSGKNYVGFELSNTNILNLGLLNNITINTYLDGSTSPVESATANQLALSVALINDAGRSLIGFVANAPFDEVEIKLNDAISLGLGTTKIYNLSIRPLCEGLDLNCNEIVSINESDFPVIAKSSPDGIACVNCETKSLGNILDGNNSTAAEIVLTASAGSSASVSVKNEIDEFPVNTYVAFDVEHNEIVDVDGLNSIKIRLFNEGNEVQILSSNQLAVGVGSSLIGGRSRTLYGIVSDVVFDEVELEFDQLVAISMGDIKVYDFVILKSCPVNIVCNKQINLVTDEMAVILNTKRTGVEGLATVGSNIIDPLNVLTPSETDVTKLLSVVGGVTKSSLSIEDPVNIYPRGSYAGFLIKKNNFILSADLISALSIKTRLNGTVKDDFAVGTLLDLTVGIPIFTGLPTGSYYFIGAQATEEFDEITLSFQGIAGLDDFVDVYKAVLGIRTPLSDDEFSCLWVADDENIGKVNVEVTGQANLNDYVPLLSEYTLESSEVNPSLSLPIINSNGNYTFETDIPGIYKFNLGVNPNIAYDEKQISILTIKIVEMTDELQDPLAMDDYFVVHGSLISTEPNNFKVYMNDQTSAKEETFNNPSSTSSPSHGTLTMQGNEFVYTPEIGYFGPDLYSYEICESPSNKCVNAIVNIEVLIPGGNNFTLANDDLLVMPKGSTKMINLTANDSDPEGDNILIYTDTLSLMGGELKVQGTGNAYYTSSMTEIGFTEYVYEIHDAGTPMARSSATLNILVTDETPLPLSLLEFNAVKRNNESYLFWKIANSEPNEYFIVQRSFDAKTWTEIATVQIDGKSKFNFVDKTPQKGNNFYRLKVANKNSNYEAYSQIKLLKYAELNAVNIYPNPSQGNIILDGSNSISFVKVYDQLGKLCVSFNLNLTNKVFDISTLVNGTYLVECFDESNAMVHKQLVIKQQ